MTDRSLTPSPYVQVGKSGLFVYQVGLGTMQFGWSVDEPASFSVLDTYAEAGGNFIDTADCYSSWSRSLGGPSNPGGVSEAIVGRWLRSREIRDEMVVATKVRAPMGEQFGDHRGTRRQREGLSRRWIMKACEDSLRRLQVDHIDLYQAHYIDPFVPIEETLSALSDLVRQGKVRYIGCSNFSAWRLMQALWASDSHGFEHFVSVQPEYNLFSASRTEVETELAPACDHYGLGLLPYSPLAGGVLTGKYRKGAELPESVRAEENAEKRFNDRNWEVVERLVEVAEELQKPPAQVAIQWLLAKRAVAAPIVGANRPDQLTGVLEGLETALPSDAIRSLDKVSNIQLPRASLEV